MFFDGKGGKRCKPLIIRDKPFFLIVKNARKTGMQSRAGLDAVTSIQS
jgi:hypothetical protein